MLISFLCNSTFYVILLVTVYLWLHVKDVCVCMCKREREREDDACAHTLCACHIWRRGGQWEGEWMSGKETRRNEHQTDGCYLLRTSVKNIMGCIGSRTISKNIPHYFPPCGVVKRSVCRSCSRVEVCREGEMRGSLQGCTIIFTFLQIALGVILLHVSCLSFIWNVPNCVCVCVCVGSREAG